MTSPQPPLRPRLAIAALLLIPLAALWVILSSAHHIPSYPSTPGQVGTTGGAATGTLSSVAVAPLPLLPAPSPPRVVKGALRQRDFTLLGATYFATGSVFPLPTALIPAKGISDRAIIANNTSLFTGGRGMGLWIGVRGGIGFKTLTVPAEDGRHIYPFGHMNLVVQTMRHQAFHMEQWEGPGGSPLFNEVPPYKTWPYFGPMPLGEVKTQSVFLVPSSFFSRFRVTAQALSDDGKALGSPVNLHCQPYNATTLFAQIPTGYDAQTRRFRVTAARVGGENRMASWRLADLPPAVSNGPDNLKWLTTDRIGPYSVQGSAAPDQDNSGLTDLLTTRPTNLPSYAGPYSQNMDNHVWTGVPTIRYRLNSRPVSAVSPKDVWVLELDRLTPQWGEPLDTSAYSAASLFQKQPLFLTLSNTAYPLTGPWTIQDGEIGTAYPGQQHWLKLDGSVLQSSLHTEIVTFHDAEIIYDAAFGGDRVVWTHPETETTRSGITVTVLNGHSGRRGSGANPLSPAPFGTPSWWYDRGNAELLLAWLLPPGIVPDNQAKPNSARVASLPMGVSPLAVAVDTLRPAPFLLKVAPPGENDARPLFKAGYTPMRFSTWLSGPVKRTLKPPILKPGSKPEVLPPYSWREGQEIVTAKPLPRHLKTLSLQITLREQQEQRPFHLVVPVRSSPPPDWNPKPPGVPR
jgi:hypothetical protein